MFGVLKISVILFIINISVARYSEKNIPSYYKLSNSIINKNNTKVIDKNKSVTNNVKPINENIDNISNCKENHCIRKCCPQGDSFVKIDTNMVCNKTHEYLSVKDIPFSDKNIKKHEFGFIYGTPSCKKTYSADFNILNDGSLLVIVNNYYDEEILNYMNKKNDINNYCIDILKQDPSNGIISRVCYIEEQIASENQHKGLWVSVLFFLVTLIVYIVIPELQNIHGLCVMSHMACFFTGYVLYLFIIEIKSITSNIKCKFLGKYLLKLLF